MAELFPADVKKMLDRYVELLPAASEFAGLDKALKEWFGTADAGIYDGGAIAIVVSDRKSVKIKVKAVEYPE